jgi:WD40 repeat protein
MQLLQGHIGTVNSLSFADDGVHLASSGVAGNRVALWDLRHGTRTELTAASGVIYQAAFAPRGPALMARQGATVTLWANPVARRDLTVTWESHTFEFSPDGTEIAYTSPADSTAHWVRFRFTAGGRGREPILVTRRPPADLFWRPDGLHLLQPYRGRSGDTFLDLFTFVSRTDRSFHRWAAAPPSHLAVSLDGRTLIGVHAADPTLRRWAIPTGQPLPELIGHAAAVTALAYLPDGRLLSCDAAGLVRLWDPASGRCLDVKDWQLGPLSALATGHDGMRAAVGCENGTILVWDVD